ncbi:MCP four helix bundle domain-containing protein [uncultured Proteiniphilum sp.]|uniref:MCP four helix bundle domain-containing protein n=1 Tax=uncultured Proteiniphilum sp. TaxID=497637 RepID=UPI0026344D40|nr:MCP four helix bundle domain-containing protein [uncultured Proteiniphilum sp.]
MVKSLKIKIVLSLSLLILMLMAAGIMSILDFRKIGDSVDIVLKNNYQSIESAKKMLDAVEREDSGILLWMLGNKDSGIKTVLSSDSIIRKAIVDMEKNITETDEARYVIAVRDEYEQYQSSVKKILENGRSIEESELVYDTETDSLFFKTKEAIDKLMALNQDQMYRQAGIVKEQSRRAMMPAIISIAAAIIFALLLYFFIRIYFIRPVRQLIDSVKEYYPEKGRLDAGMVSKDEFKQLEEELNQLIYRLRRTKNSI